MKRRAVIERAIGETRAAVYEGRRLVELHVDRASNAAAPKVGEVWTGRVVAVDPSVAGAFVTLGEGPDALLPFRAQKDLPRLGEGMLIDLRVAKEAVAEKGPVLRYHGAATADAPGAVDRLDLSQRLERRFPGITFEDASVGVIDNAVERTVALPGGGSITIDRTQALIAIDVDKGGASSTFECAQKAATLAMAQLRLRGLGGLVVIDFPNLRQPKQRSAVIRILEEMGETDPASVRVAPFSRFGVVELTRGTDGPSLDAKLTDRFGEPTPETLALSLLRRLEREGRASGGAKLSATADAPTWNGLQALPFDWRAELAARIGARFAVEPGETTEVSADR